MTNIDMALDDLISKQKGPQPTVRSGGKRPGPRVDGPLTPNRRTGGAGDRRQFGSFGGGGGSRFGQKQRDDDVVWINIANLPETVSTMDLQDLFQDFKPYGVGVHYNEYGQHMGTADLFVDTRSAQNILLEFAKIAIDGQKMRFAIVNEQANNTPQFINNQQRLGTRTRPSGNSRPGPARFGGRRGRSQSGHSSRTYSSRSRSPLNRAVGGNRAAGGSNRASGNKRGQAVKVKSSEELDRELELYMKGNKHPRIKLEMEGTNE